MDDEDDDAWEEEQGDEKDQKKGMAMPRSGSLTRDVRLPLRYALTPLARGGQKTSFPDPANTEKDPLGVATNTKTKMQTPTTAKKGRKKKEVEVQEVEVQKEEEEEEVDVENVFPPFHQYLQETYISTPFTMTTTINNPDVQQQVQQTNNMTPGQEEGAESGLTQLALLSHHVTTLKARLDEKDCQISHLLTAIASHRNTSITDSTTFQMVNETVHQTCMRVDIVERHIADLRTHLRSVEHRASTNAGGLQVVNTSVLRLKHDVECLRDSLRSEIRDLKRSVALGGFGFGSGATAFGGGGHYYHGDHAGGLGIGVGGAGNGITTTTTNNNNNGGSGGLFGPHHHPR